jgi:hypothetical protein
MTEMKSFVHVICSFLSVEAHLWIRFIIFRSSNRSQKSDPHRFKIIVQILNDMLNVQFSSEQAPPEGAALPQGTVSAPVPAAAMPGSDAPATKSEGLPEIKPGLTPPGGVVLPGPEQGVDEMGWRPPEKAPYAPNGFVPKHSDHTGTTGVTTDREGGLSHPAPIAGRAAREQGVFGGLGVASKPVSELATSPGERLYALSAQQTPVRGEQPVPVRGGVNVDPGRSPPGSSVLLSGGEEFWEKGWTTVASRDVRAELATAELDLLKESDAHLAARVEAELGVEKKAKAARAREARRLYDGIDTGFGRMQMGEAASKPEPNSPSAASLSVHSSGGDADVESQGLQGYTDSGGGGGGYQDDQALTLGLSRSPKKDGPQLDLRIATGGGAGVPAAKKTLGLSLWCGLGIEGGDQGGSPRGGEQDESPQSPLASQGERSPFGEDMLIGEEIRMKAWPEEPAGGVQEEKVSRGGQGFGGENRCGGVQGSIADKGLAFQKLETHGGKVVSRGGGMFIGEGLGGRGLTRKDSERSTPSPPITLGLDFAASLHARVGSGVGFMSVGQGNTVGSIRFGELGLGEKTRSGMKRSGDWADRLDGSVSSPERHRAAPGHPPRVPEFREVPKRPRVELSPPPPKVRPPKKAQPFDYPSSLRASVQAFLAQSTSGISQELGPGVTAPQAQWRAHEYGFPGGSELGPKAPPKQWGAATYPASQPRRDASAKPRAPPQELAPEYPPQILDCSNPEAVPGRGFPQHYSKGVNKLLLYPSIPLDPTMYPFGALPAVGPLNPYGAPPPEWAVPYLPQVLGPGFDPPRDPPHTFGGLPFLNPSGKAFHQPLWADMVARWQLPDERNGGPAISEERERTHSWPNPAPVARGSLQVGV